MFDPKKPVRYRSGTSRVEVAFQMAKSDQFRNKPMLLLVVTEPGGAQRIAYANPDGTHPNDVYSLDLLNIDTAKVASLYQTMDSNVAKALGTLWCHEQFGPVIDVMLGLDPTLNRFEVHYYFEGLWGTNA